MRIYTISITFFIMLFSGLAMAQIYAPEGLNMPGSWNSWQNPPAITALAGVQVSGGKLLPDASLATRRYRTIINVQSSGGDIVGGSYQFKFSSGPTTNYWNNNWGNGTVTMNSVVACEKNHGNNNSVTVENGFYYTVNWADIGYQNSSFSFLKTSAVPVTIDSVWGQPLTTAQNTAVTINVKLSGNKSTEEKVYLRYSTNSFSTSSAVEITNFDGTTHIGTATIPGQSTSGTIVSFYVISTTASSSSWGSQNVDLLTLSHKKNGADNFSYEVQPITSIADGNWNSAGIWNTGEVPGTGANVTINSNVTLNADANISAITINTGKTFTASDATPRTLTVAAGGSITCNGTFAHGNGTVTFAGAGSITGTVSLNNVNIANGVNFGTAATINGLFSINAGGYINTKAPIYTTGSTLKYNTGGSIPYGRYLEWSDTSGAGYPYNVQISNGTTLDLGNGGTGVERRIAGSLTIDTLCALTMNAAGNQMTKPLVIAGAITNNGTLTLSGLIGGDLYLRGNFSNNGTLTPNSREIGFTGTTQQVFSSATGATTTMNYLAVSNPAGVQLTNNTAGAFTIVNRIRFTSGAGNLTTGTDTLILGSSATIEGETSGRYVVGMIKTTRSVGTAENTFGGMGVTLAAGADVGSVTVTRYSGTVGRVTNNSASGINRKWAFSSTGAQSFAARNLSLSWVSDDDNGKDLTTAQVYSGSGSSWTTLGSQQNASASRTVTVPVTSFGSFTVSDAANQLGLSAHALTVTALIEALWNGTTTVQDTLTAELRTASAPYTLVGTAKAYPNTAGVYNFSVTGLTDATPYYVVLKHRNALETWSASTVSFSSSAASYNFTTAATQAYGSNLKLSSGKYCLFAGDINQDGIVDFSDLVLVDNDANAGLTGYKTSDLNGDQVVNATDISICDNNAKNFIGKTQPVSAKKPEAAKPVTNSSSTNNIE